MNRRHVASAVDVAALLAEGALNLAAGIATRVVAVGITSPAAAERDAEWRARIPDIVSLECAKARHDALAPIRAFHERWGDTNEADLDQLALWEELGRLIGALPGGAL